METLVCTVPPTTRCRELPSFLSESRQARHSWEQLVLNFERPSQVVFLDIDVYSTRPSPGTARRTSR